MKIGTNSFVGSILSAVGSSKYSKFIGDLSSGKVLLTIDAFDEAEIISGRKMLGDFLKDISDCLGTGEIPSVLLFSRTETAQFIASFCVDNSIPLIHYEIGFFDDSKAIKFIEFFVKSKDRNKNLTKADVDCINEYYYFIKDKISITEQKRFLGYAPVLQAIVQQIISSSNRQKLKNELLEKKDCASIIVSIMESLLRREREEKVIPALKKKWSERYPKFEDWEKLYSDEEQLVRIVYYILFGDSEYNNYPIKNFPVPMIEDYQEALSAFLPQHPYLGSDFNEKASDPKTNFVGPAFRDYTMAQLLLKPDSNDLVKMYLGELKGKTYTPSKLLFDCYHLLSGGTVQSDHITYVYDSFRARATAMEKPYLQCSELSTEENSYSVIFGMLNKLVEVEEIEMELGVVDSSLEFEQAVNLSIDTPSLSVKLGKTKDEMRITNSSIICKEIIWGSKDITIESYSPEGCLLVSYHSMSGEHPTFEIASKEELKVCAPNINQYAYLVGYRYDFEKKDNLDITKFIYALRCILMEFRTHKKDTLAKTAERIENVIVGGSEIKQSVFEYLKYSGIIYLDAHLFKINEGMLKSKGIFFSAVARMNIEELASVYDDFNDWLKISDKSDLKI